MSAELGRQALTSSSCLTVPVFGPYRQFFARGSDQTQPCLTLQPHWQEERPSAAVNFTAGTLASVAATLATQPADVVRTHIQLGLSKPLPPGTRPLGGLRVVQNLVKAQGPGVLLAGALPRVSTPPLLVGWSVPVCWADGPCDRRGQGQAQAVLPGLVQAQPFVKSRIPPPAGLGYHGF